MRIRMIATALAAAALGLGAPGCAGLTRWVSSQPVSANPLVVPSNDFEVVWRETVAALDPYFNVRSENRLARTIVTDPVIGATILEPWLADSTTPYERLESTFQTMRRFAQVKVTPVPGRGYAVKVEVFKELEFLGRPDRAAAGRAVFNNDFPVNRTREIVGPVPVATQWIPRGRDADLEQAILARLKANLFL